ncbi:hypothetical protein AM501_23415 [Aneurinibacillus migulanus]|uniref:Nucleotide-binding universal stress protein, UspA family n=1 Tax=Aneurinibacillus migulanus TaxID=47500 RepID=A0A0D1YCI1_ANEMI|nr:universal stress protein [Aneurinibacillus migulanus]KIV56777.1 hypothetical protein TS64_08335 [Aneurinibacillus migulanus]KIV60147.1 hypothetical protein TS65_01715 [Aneurinibacillus migulanus]KON96734.1 hypothetical protein AF333_15870 [Aneurinibacillus migulanus]KPD05930.1 hypothetical protein AM501_23415 [Aneurinibacillus migulanus]MED0893489.1 universal stress protein [Aneurinibacillus migulanus]
MNKILLAVDGSAYDEKSVAFINDKAAKVCNIDVYVASVLPNVDATLLHVYPGLKDEYRAHTEKLLTNTVQKLTVHGNASWHILEGDVAKKLLEFAEQTGVDLIVMGCRGLSNYEELVLGSVSMKVIRSSSCPVVIVK